MDDATSAAYGLASDFLVDLVALVGRDDWTRPALGEWRVLELVAHANRSHNLVVSYLEEPQPPAGPEYFTPDAIARRGREAVAALGDDPVGAVRRDAEAARHTVERSAAGAVVGSPMGTMSLGAYLPSRTAELVIHGIDLADSLGVAAAPPAAASGEAIAYVGALAGRRGLDVALLRAATGRAPLPPDYSVY